MIHENEWHFLVGASTYIFYTYIITKQNHSKIKENHLQNKLAYKQYTINKFGVYLIFIKTVSKLEIHNPSIRMIKFFFINKIRINSE